MMHQAIEEAWPVWGFSWHASPAQIRQLENKAPTQMPAEVQHCWDQLHVADQTQTQLIEQLERLYLDYRRYQQAGKSGRPFVAPADQPFAKLESVLKATKAKKELAEIELQQFEQQRTLLAVKYQAALRAHILTQVQPLLARGLSHMAWRQTQETWHELWLSCTLETPDAAIIELQQDSCRTLLSLRNHLLNLSATGENQVAQSAYFMISGQGIQLWPWTKSSV